MSKAFINSMPKAGTNLLAQCLILFGFKDKRTIFFEKAGIGSYLVAANTIPSKIRKILWGKSNTGYLVGIDSPVYVPKRPIDRMLTRMSDRNFMTGHVGYNNDILFKIQSLGIVPFLMIRDPRAILSSFVNYVLSEKKHPLHTAFTTANNLQRYKYALYGMEEDGDILKPLVDRCLAIEPWAKSNAVCKVKFEELVGEKGGGVRRAQIDTLIRISNALDLDDSSIGFVANNIFGSGRSTFRTGNINSWRSDIPEAIKKEASHILEPVIRLWQYDQ